jgi:phenylacetate-CoA ligase
MLAILYQLEQSQWWSAEDLRRHQATQLAQLARHARETVPFYRQRLAHLGDAKALDPQGEAWLGLPLLTRADIQNEGDALLSDALPPGHGRTNEIYTSGSTGRPIRAVRSELWGLFWSAFTVRDHLWHRRDFRGTLAAIRESGKGKDLYPDGTTTRRWGRASGSLFATGPTVSLNITTPIPQQMEWLRRRDPDYLLTHPTIAHRLAQHSLQHGLRLPKLKQIETISEILRPATREIVAAAWGVPIVDLYTTREAGYLALQCPDHQHYHVQSESILVEVLDDVGRPCGPGRLGRVIVTPMHNFAMPLIRYDIGDFGETGEACACGRGLPVLKRILGRKQNMLTLPGGEERWPLLSSSNIGALLALAPIRQYQFRQLSADMIELRLAVAQDLTPAQESAVKTWVEEKFGHPFEVKFSYCEEIPPAPSGKFEDFVSLIGRGAPPAVS